MISKKTFIGDGNTTRFLSDFIIRDEQYTRPYVYIYDNTLPADGSGDVLQNGSTSQIDWRWPDNVWKRGYDAPKSNDLVTVDKWQVVDNSILFYTAPLANVKLWIEVATTSEEFGTTLTQPAVEQAESAAGSANVAQLAAEAAEASAQIAKSASEAAQAAAIAAQVAAQADADAAEAAKLAAQAAQGLAETAKTAAQAAQGLAESAASAAAASASSASTSASNASTSATNAANSASSASTSATNALNSANAAAASALAASNSASSAAASAASAAAALAAIGTAIADEIGVTIQGYDADTVKYDVAGKFSAAQRMEIVAEDNAIDFTTGNNFNLTATAADLTVASVTAACVGQTGVMTIASAENLTGFGIEFVWKTVPTDLLGTERIAYHIESTSVIALGRVQ